jgi:hypothetical protein
MSGFFVAAAMAFLATVIFAFQYSYWNSNGLLAGVFLLVLVADLLAVGFLPPGIFHPVIGIVCLGMGGALLVAHRVIERVAPDEDDGAADE